MKTSGAITIQPAGDQQDGSGHDRLAELVVHLTDCAAPLAVAAVNQAVGDEEPSTEDERLLVVARAMLSVRRGIDLRS